MLLEDYLVGSTLIYSSEHDELSSRCLWSKIKGRSNIMILFRTSFGALFGSYHSILPPTQDIPVTDPLHYVLVWEKGASDSTQFKCTTGHTNCLYICGDQSTTVLFYISGFCDIRSNGRSWFFSQSKHSTSFNQCYSGCDTDTQLITHHEYPETFDVYYLNIYQLN